MADRLATEWLNGNHDFVLRNLDSLGIISKDLSAALTAEIAITIPRLALTPEQCEQCGVAFHQALLQRAMNNVVIVSHPPDVIDVYGEAVN